MSERSKVSIFLSSPADVQAEREAAERVISRLGGVYGAHVELALERWERRFYEASMGFQDAIAAMETFDLVIGVFWKRIGSELPPDRFHRPDGTSFESGTVFEIETAIEASRSSGRPAVYIFRKSSPVTYNAEHVDEQRAQKEALDRWWGNTFRDEAGHYIAATNNFADAEEFETRFENCIVDWLEDRDYIPSGPVWDVATRGSPYPGLVAYDRDRSPVFFGRQLAVEQARDELLATTMREDGLPALFVIGASGSGKSSLVRAGLVPRLTRPGVVPGIDVWRTVVTVPAVDSLASFAAHLYEPDGLPELTKSAQHAPQQWARMAAGSPEAAADAIAWALDRAAEAEGRRVQADRKLNARLLLVFDQLESIFGTSGQDAFIKVLHGLVNGGRVWLIATLRSDRYAEFQLDANLLALKRAGATYDLPPPGPAEIADVVKGPARAAGLTFGERNGTSLARVLAEAAPNADALPLLQMALAQLFERRAGTELTFVAYEAMGGVEGAIAAHANTVFDQVAPAAQVELDPLVRELVRDIARRSDGQVRFTARTADGKIFATNTARRALVEKLVEERLLVSDAGNLRVAHEALLRRWDRARDSLRRLADAELRKARLQRAAAIAAAVVFLAVAGVAVWQGLEAQHQATIAEAELDRRLEADTARLAQAARRETDQGRAGLGTQLATMALASHAEAKTPPPSHWRAVDALAWSMSAGPLPLADLRHDAWIFSAAFSPDGRKVVTAAADHTVRLWDAGDGRELLVLRLDDMLSGAFFSPDGSKLLTASGDSPAHVWNADTGAELAILQGDKGERFKTFSPDGQKVLTISEMGATRLLSAGDGRELLVLRHGPPVYIAQFSPDGRKIVTVSEDGGVRVWEAATGAALAVFRTHAILAFAFSPDGRKIVTASRDGTARLLDIANGSELLVLRHQGGVFSAVFSPDGRTILTASTALQNDSALVAQARDVAAGAMPPDGGVQLWDATTGARLVAFRHQQAMTVYEAVFSPDGRYVLTAAADTARLWDAATGAELAVLPHQHLINSAVFSPDGQKILTKPFPEAGNTNPARLWDVGHGRDVLTFQHQQPIITGAFSPDGKKVLAASGDRTLHVRDASSGRDLLVLQQEGTIDFADFSRDGRYVVTGSGDGSARLWDATSGKELTIFWGHTGPVRTAKFSPDGRQIVTASHDRTARIWDAASGAELALLRHANDLYAARFSPDGQKVVTFTEDDTIVDGQSLRAALAKRDIDYDTIDDPVVLAALAAEISPKPGSVEHGVAFRLWDANDGRELLALRHEGGIKYAELSPDGRKIVMAVADGTLRLADAATGAELMALSGHEGTVTYALFSSDGQKIASTSVDGTARVWDAATGRELATLRGHDDAVGSASFSRDGQLVATASVDGTARVWDVGTGVQLAVLRGHEGPVKSVRISPDGEKMLTYSDERTARLWRLPAYRSEGELVAYAKGLALPALTAEQCREFGILAQLCSWPP